MLAPAAAQALQGGQQGMGMGGGGVQQAMANQLRGGSTWNTPQPMPTTMPYGRGQQQGQQPAPRPSQPDRNQIAKAAIEQGNPNYKRRLGELMQMQADRTSYDDRVEGLRNPPQTQRPPQNLMGGGLPGVYNRR